MPDGHSEEIKKENKKSTSPFPWLKIGIFFSTIAIVIFISAFSYGYFELTRANVSLAQMITDLQNQIVRNQNDVTALQQNLQKSQTLFVEQAKIIAEWRAAQKGDLERWQAAEAQYLVKLANHQLQFNHNISLAIILLQTADQILQNLHDPNLLPIRQVITTDLANLRAAQQVDVTSLYQRLVVLNGQLDQLPLPTQPIKSAETIPTEATSLPWWQKGLQQSWQTLKQIVVVRYHPANSLPLVMPEEKMFLYQNLHAQLENAMWGVLHQNAVIYQTGLDRSITWIQKYFVQDAQTTQTVLQNLQELKQINLLPPVLTLAAPLLLFEHYFAEGKS